MERARNSESETHVKKSNPTSRTEIRHKSLCYIFFSAPCRNALNEPVVHTLLFLAPECGNEIFNLQCDRQGPEFRTWSGSRPKCQKRELSEQWVLAEWIMLFLDSPQKKTYFHLTLTRHQISKCSDMSLPKITGFCHLFDLLGPYEANYEIVSWITLYIG